MKSKTNSNLLAGFFKETVVIQITLAIIVVFIIWFFNWTVELVSPLSSTQYASLVIHYQDRQRMFEGEVVEGMTILDALSASSVAGKIELQYDYTDDGKTEIKKINGYSKDVQNVRFFLNNTEIVSEDIGTTSIRSGDRIEVMFK